MVPEHPHDGLTVDYGRYFTTHLASVVYNDNNSRIILPDEQSKKFFKQSIDYEEIACNPESISTYYKEKMDLALSGKFEDLEGFMVAFTSDSGDLLYVKLKFPWYYAAHKPDTNFQAAEELSFNPKYNLIRDKLVNLAISAEKREARRNPSKQFMGLANLIRNAYIKFKDTFTPINKKDFMIHYRENDSYFSKYTGIEEALDEACKKLYIKNEFSVDKLIPSLWDMLLKIQDSNEALMIEFISEYIVKSWKISNKY